MIFQRDIQGAYLRAAYSELVGNADGVVWFGAGSFASRLAAAISDEQRSAVAAIYDDNPSLDGAEIAGIPVRKPIASDDVHRVVLATDTHAVVMTERVRAIHGSAIDPIDLHAPSRESWIDPGDSDAGFARTHPERWRDAVGLAQLQLEADGVVCRRARWRLAHRLLNGADLGFRFRPDRFEQFEEARRRIPEAAVLTIAGANTGMDPRWRRILETNHTAISPGGSDLAVTWAPIDRYPACPVRTGPALWVPREASCVIGALYDGPGEKAYTVRFDAGEEISVTATRERTYEDLRGGAELARYEAFLAALPSGARVLDCATGTGQGAALLAAEGFAVTGVDVCPEAIAFAKSRRPGIEFVCASAAALPFDRGSFGAVISIETVEHLPAPSDAIAEFARVCRPGGLLCLTTPDEGGCDSPFHEVEMTAADLRSALDSAFGAGGWTGEPIAGAAGWHAMVVRPAQPAHL